MIIKTPLSKPSPINADIPYRQLSWNRIVYPIQIREKTYWYTYNHCGARSYTFPRPPKLAWNILPDVFRYIIPLQELSVFAYRRERENGQKIHFFSFIYVNLNKRTGVFWTKDGLTLLEKLISYSVGHVCPVMSPILNLRQMTFVLPANIRMLRHPARCT